MAQTFFPIAEVNLTNGAQFAWGDINVSAYVPVDATGVILHIWNGSGTSGKWGVRRNGSTDNRSGESNTGNWHTWAVIGLDANKIFEFYNVATAPRIDANIVGYVKGGVNFTPSYTTAPLISPTGTGSWETKSLSAQGVPANAVGVIVEVYAGVGATFGYRMTGSSDNRFASMSANHTTFGFIIGCNASQQIDLYRGGTGVNFYLIGYITEGATFYQDAVNVTPSGWTGSLSWKSCPNLPAGGVMPFLEAVKADDTYFGAKGSISTSTIYTVGRHTFALPGLGSLAYEAYGKTGATVWLVGYAQAKSGGAGLNPAIIEVIT